jgi:hypothetical protein
MKKLFLLLILAAASRGVMAQSVIETVGFDNYGSATDNDLTNRFLVSRSASNFSTQVTTGGITGGALMPPSASDYNLDYYFYCSTYANPVGVLTETSVCFKYNAALINPNVTLEPIKLKFDSDAANHYLICQIRRYSTAQPGVFEMSYSTNSSNGQTTISANTLVTGHWYKFVVQHRSDGGQFSDQVYAKLELFDIGTGGTSTPVSVASRSANFTDALWVASTQHTINIAGSRQGGAELLDNFSFSGPKAGSLCSVVSGTHKQQLLDAGLEVYPNPTKGKVMLHFRPGFEQKVNRVELLDMMGKSVNVAVTVGTGNTLALDVATVAPGSYVVRVSTGEGNFLRKLILE